MITIWDELENVIAFTGQTPAMDGNDKDKLAIAANVSDIQETA